MKSLSFRRMFSNRLVVFLALVFCCNLTCHAQITDDTNIGLPLNGSFDGDNLASVQITNGNLHIELPVWAYKGRGLPTGVKYVYDAKQWEFNTTCNPAGICHDTVVGGHDSVPMLSLVTPFSYGFNGRITAIKCQFGSTFYQYSYQTVTEPGGTSHPLSPWRFGAPGNTCGLPAPSTLYAEDGSGWIVNLTWSNVNITSFAIISKNGTNFNSSQCSMLPCTFEDSNGNQLVSNPGTSVTDTLGRTIPLDGSYYDSSATLRSLQVINTSVTVNTNLCQFSQSDSCTESTGTWTVPQTITFANGMSYTFNYVQNAYAQPSSITLPTGGQITFTWNGPLSWTGPAPDSRTETANGVASTWTYKYKTPTINQATVTDPAGNDTVHTFQSWLGSNSLSPSYQTKAQYYSGSYASGTLLKTVATDYTPIPNATDAALQIPIRDTTTWNPQNLVSKVETDWDFDGGMTWRNPVERREYGYGTGTYGSLVRTVHTTYLHLDPTLGPTYKPLNIADRPLKVSKYAGSSSGGTLTAQTSFTYDGGSLSSTSGVPNHDYTKYGTSNTHRGNATQVGRGLLVNGVWTWLNTNNTYDDLGNLLTSTDPGGHPATLDYTDSWGGSGCVGTANTHAFVTKTTDALSHRVQKSYYPCTGLTYSLKDENDIANSRAGTTQTYDLMNRPLITSFPDGGMTTKSYTDSGNISTTTSQLISGSVSLTKTTVLDGLGRVSQTQLQNDPDCSSGTGLVKVDYAYGYDASQYLRFEKVSTPYCNSPDTTFGLMTTTNHDALDRVTSVVQTDGSTVTTSYSGSTAGITSIVTDEAGKQRKSQTDALGRLTAVFEDPGGLNYETDYAYDVLDDLTSVIQTGGGTSGSYRIRTFTYDSLSRLTCAANPEVTPSTATPVSCPTTNTSTYTNGTIQYTYDADGNVLTKKAGAPNQTFTSTTVTTNYSYDVLHRLTQKSYTGGNPSTATVNYAYDNNSLGSCAPTFNPADANPIGRRTSMCDGSGGTAWFHDPMGRVLRDKETINGSSPTTQALVYTYNLDGSMASLQYPSGRLITYTPNAAGRTVSAQDTANSINYVINAMYAPQGALAGYTNHASLLGRFSYNSRLQPLQLVYTSTAPPDSQQLAQTTCPTTLGNIMHRVYHFGAGSNDNGNVQSVDNCIDTNRTVTYAYDALNRIQSATTQGTTCGTPCWGQLFGHMVGRVYVSGYDGWGNLHEITATQGAPTTLGQAMSLNNQFVGMTYDAAGNLINDGGGHTYTYDGENQLVAIPGWTYKYDGDGRRVEKCSSCTSASGGTLYWMGAGSDALVESNLAGTLSYEYIFFNGKRVARRDGTSNPPAYYFADHLGSTSVVTAAGGVIKDQSDYYPFGGEVVITNTLPQNYKFTGKERDAESGLDNFGARYNASSMGRFMSADPVFMNVMRVMDPQRLNLYAYGRNNPLVYTDPTGKDIVSGTGDQKAIKSALVEIARHPGGRQMLTKLDNLTQKITLSTTKDKIYDNNGTRTPGHHIADPPDAPINRTTDKAGNVDITSPNVKVEIDPSFAQTMRDAQDSNAPKSDAQLLGHELTETEHQDFQPGFNPDQHEGQTNSEVDSMLGSSNDMSKKDAEKFVDNLLKPNTNNQQQQQQPPPPPKCTGDNKQNCSN